MRTNKNDALCRSWMGEWILNLSKTNTKFPIQIMFCISAEFINYYYFFLFIFSFGEFSGNTCKKQNNVGIWIFCYIFCVRWIWVNSPSRASII